MKLTEIESGSSKYCLLTFFLLFFLVPSIDFSPGAGTQWVEKWSIVHISVTIICIVWLFHLPQFPLLPKLNRDECILLFIIALLQLMSIAYNRGRVSWIEFSEQIGFFILVIFFWGMFQSNKFVWNTWIALPSLAALLVNLSLWTRQLTFCSDIRLNEPVCAVGTFGNANMLSEGIALMWCLALPFIFNTEKKWHSTIYLLGIWSLVAIILGHSRSILIAIFLFFFWIFLESKSWKKLSLLSLLFVVGFASLDQHSTERWQLLQSSMDLIRENALGVGIGNFQFSSLPYEVHTRNGLVEMETAKSSHNVFLSLASEDGVFFVILFFIFCALLIARGYKNGENHMSKAFLCLFSVQFFFQFPNENPYTFVGLAAVSALSLRNRPAVKFSTSKVGEFLIFLCSIVSILLFSTFIYLHRFSPRLTTVPSVDKFLCHLSSDFWKKCWDSANYFRARGNYHEAEKWLLEGLRWNSSNYFFYREYLNLVEKNPNHCEDIINYNQIFVNLTDKVLGCPNPIPKSPIEAWNQYEQRVQELLNSSRVTNIDSKD